MLVEEMTVVARPSERLKVRQRVETGEGLAPSLPLKPSPSLPSRIAIVGNYLPRQCGIATFTTDLCNAVNGEYGAAELRSGSGQRPGIPI